MGSKESRTEFWVTWRRLYKRARFFPVLPLSGFTSKPYSIIGKSGKYEFN